MKKIFRKNQLVITALALMIAVAGYFSYMNNNMDDGKLQTAAEAANAEVSAGELEEDYDISDEDVLQNEIFTAEEPDGTETAAVTDGSAETAAGTEGEPAAEGTGQTVADGTAAAGADFAAFPQAENTVDHRGGQRGAAGRGCPDAGTAGAGAGHSGRCGADPHLSGQDPCRSADATEIQNEKE